LDQGRELWEQQAQEQAQEQQAQEVQEVRNKG
jgi:hypothetical protein